MMKTTFIPQNILRVAAALLFTMIIAVGFTACTNKDNSVVTSSPEVVVGKWYYELNQHDTFGQGEDAFEFDKIAIYGNLNADGSGWRRADGFIEGRRQDS